MCLGIGKVNLTCRAWYGLSNSIQGSFRLPHTTFSPTVSEDNKSHDVCFLSPGTLRPPPISGRSVPFPFLLFEVNDPISLFSSVGLVRDSRFFYFPPPKLGNEVLSYTDAVWRSIDHTLDR